MDILSLLKRCFAPSSKISTVRLESKGLFNGLENELKGKVVLLTERRNETCLETRGKGKEHCDETERRATSIQKEDMSIN